MPDQTKKLDPAEKSSTTMNSKGMEKILQRGGLFLLASLFGNGLNYLFGVFIARNLGSEQFGLYSLGFTLINILLFIVPMGMDTAIVKFSSEQLTHGDELKAANTIFHALVLVGFLSFVFSLILAVTAAPFSVALFKKSGLVAVLLFFALTFPFSSIGNLLINALQAFQVFRIVVFIKYIW
ncbi:MAG: lipopolysaccharide biosynthesis protein, partial [Nitrospiria bacterium]